MIPCSGLTFSSGHVFPPAVDAGLKIHDPDEELRLLRSDLDRFTAALSDARKELGAFAEDGVPTAECVRNLKADYEAEIKRLRDVVIENEIDRNDDWTRSELEGEQG